MLITPSDVKAYTTFKKVKNRPEPQLEMDILEATTEAERYVGHDFSDTDIYDPLPTKVRLALLKLAQFYALINSDESIAKGYKSEKFENYSYTLADGESVRKPDVSVLLRDYVVLPVPKETGNVKMRMRPL
ncbi:protein YqbG [Alkalicoccobacillus plakortidis]|uniref:DUF3199 family protein n=1 Tax=Alkalicoccobacillus plakortidis TaxID=444060 RepID=A0ABT0XDV9_9BACI|nr:DUF3199 family protein [Alkalicoccobacillus plakortidis]MCM2674089.1 DUF3199 family protein [Alkalicoccobacillus plakortidis]